MRVISTGYQISFIHNQFLKLYLIYIRYILITSNTGLFNYRQGSALEARNSGTTTDKSCAHSAQLDHYQTQRVGAKRKLECLSPTIQFSVYKKFSENLHDGR